MLGTGTGRHAMKLKRHELQRDTAALGCVERLQPFHSPMKRGIDIVRNVRL